jgi:two-component system OmpR family response regulator
MLAATDVARSGGRILHPDTRPAHAPALGRVVRHVVVVDDERDLADLAEALLCSAGLTVKVAYCAVDALQILEDDPEVDAVFSDVRMPGMSGLQLAEVIGHLYPSVKVVLTSGFTSPAMLARHGQPYAYASKPYLIDTVLALLRS